MSSFGPWTCPPKVSMQPIRGPRHPAKGGMGAGPSGAISGQSEDGIPLTERAKSPSTQKCGSTEAFTDRMLNTGVPAGAKTPTFSL